MIGNMKNIVDVKVYSKPQDIFKHLLNGDYRVILHSHKNKRLFKKLGLRSWSIKTLYLNKKSVNLKRI